MAEYQNFLKQESSWFVIFKAETSKDCINRAQLKPTQITRELQIPNFKASQEWLNHFTQYTQA